MLIAASMTATSSQSCRVSSARGAAGQVALRAITALLLVLGVALASSPAQAADSPVQLQSATTMLAGTININTASGTQLQLLPGVGPATAAKILAYRIRRPFGHPTHLLRIKGIGRKTFGALRRYVTVQGETTLHVPADP